MEQVREESKSGKGVRDQWREENKSGKGVREGNEERKRDKGAREKLSFFSKK